MCKCGLSVISDSVTCLGCVNHHTGPKTSGIGSGTSECRMSSDRK